MTTISTSTRLESVEHILVSGTETLDFALEGANEYRTWHGVEAAEWTVMDVNRIENTDEDRMVVYPDAEYFTCEVSADGDVDNHGPVRCWCDK